MSKKKYTLGLGFLIIAAVFLTACGGQPAEPQVIVQTVVVPGEPVSETVTIEVDVPDFPEGTELKILQWSHFVPQYDVWLDPFAEAWGDANGVDVTRQLVKAFLHPFGFVS